MIRVSVVIPTFNRADDLKRALESVVAQTYSGWEAIVVDNHSTDHTARVVRAFAHPRITLLPIHNNGVIAASRNLGIAHSAGEFVAFLDSDDWWDREKLAVSMAELDRGADLVYHDMYVVKRVGEQSPARHKATRPLKRPLRDDLILGGNAIVTSSVVVRRERMMAINGFSEEPALVAAEDYEAWLRLTGVTERFVHIPRLLGFYWQGGGNYSSVERSLRHMARLRQLHFNEFTASRGIDLPWWFTYHVGRCNYLAGNFAAAREQLNLARRQKLPLSIRAKARWMMLRMGLAGSA